MLAQPSWQPLLDGADAAAAWPIIDEIAVALERPPPPYEGRLDDPALAVSLGGHHPGFALFYAYLDRARPGRGHAQLARAHMETAMAAFADAAATRPFFAYGFTGLAWAAEHLSALLALPDDALDEVDEAVLALARAHAPEQELGWRKGLVGYATYALERAPRAAALAILAVCVERLAAFAERDGDAAAWRLRAEWLMPHDRRERPQGFLATGVVEGAAGVVGVAGAAAALGVAGAAELAEAGLRWLGRQWQQDGVAAFAAFAGGGPSVPGWTDGDAGVVGALQALPETLVRAGGDHLLADAVDRLRRRTPVDSPVLDASLANGSAGVAHVLNRLWQARGRDHALGAAARRWAVAAMQARAPGAGIAGFLFHSPEVEAEYISELPVGRVAYPGLLHGAAGVGLALLAMVCEVAPDWDRALLLSRRPA